MTEFFVGDNAIQKARTLKQLAEQVLPTFSSGGWCAVLKKGIFSISYTTGEEALRSKLAHGHRLIAIIAMAVDDRQKPTEKNAMILRPPSEGQVMTGQSVLVFDGAVVRSSPLPCLGITIAETYRPVRGEVLRLAQRMILSHLAGTKSR